MIVGMFWYWNEVGEFNGRFFLIGMLASIFGSVGNALNTHDISKGFGGLMI
jgi:hypothetical protein